MKQGPMAVKTATSDSEGLDEGKNFKTLPQKDSRVERKGHESYGGETQKGYGQP